MRSRLPAVLVSVLLLTACGSQPAAQPEDPACVALPGGVSSEVTSGVKITGVSRGVPHCAEAEFELTNSGSEAANYTITFAFLAGSGEALSNPEHPMQAVPPGRTVRDSVTVSELRSDVARVKIIKVRRVPTAEQPTKSGSCPRSGVHLYADDDADAAMGLRVQPVQLPL